MKNYVYFYKIPLLWATYKVPLFLTIVLFNLKPTAIYLTL